MADAVEAFSPAKLVFESVWNRRRIIASYWVVILVALPLWWKTTSIERLGLPASRVKTLDEKEVRLWLILVVAVWLTGVQLRFPVQVDVANIGQRFGKQTSGDISASLQEVARGQGVDVQLSTDAIVSFIQPVARTLNNAG